MAEFLRKYRFLGTGKIWDKDENEVLCQFNRQGIFETIDTIKIRKLIKLRVPYDGGHSDDLANAEFAIEILTDRVNVQDEINENLKLRLARFESQCEVDKKPTREVLLAELDYYGLPYVPSSQDITLVNTLKEYKELLRLKQEKLYEKPVKLL